MDSEVIRSELRIPDFYPTDPQAEVLVFDSISADYILSIQVENYDVIDNLGEIMVFSGPPIDFEIGNRFFRPRADYKFWPKRTFEPVPF